MNGPRSLSAYTALLRLYPRDFRAEYGNDMAQLFADQARDEPLPRVWIRSIADLAITLPTRHLETRMHRAPSTAVPLAFAFLSVAAMIFSVVTGTNAGVFAAGLLVALVSGVFAILAWRNVRGVATARSSAENWWKFLAGGAGALVAIIIVINLTGELREPFWFPTMILLLGSFVTFAAGVLLGIAHFTAGHHESAAS